MHEKGLEKSHDLSHELRQLDRMDKKKQKYSVSKEKAGDGLT